MNKRVDEDFGEDIASFFQRALPFLSSLFFLLFSYVPLSVGLLSNIRPSVLMMCVFFWMIHRPDLFNLVSVYMLGLIDDIISSVPLGTNVLTFLILYIILNGIYRFLNGKPFIISWYGFAAVAAIGFFVKWFLLSVYYSQFLPFSIVGFSYLVTIAFYPLLSMVLAFVQNTMIKDEGGI